MKLGDSFLREREEGMWGNGGGGGMRLCQGAGDAKAGRAGPAPPSQRMNELGEASKVSSARIAAWSYFYQWCCG